MSDTTVAHTPPWERERPTWGFAEGDELAEGRTVLRRIGGGRRYEALLVWDEHRLALLVAKVLRPDCAEDPHALRDLAREAALLERLAHPVLVRSFGVVRGGRFPHLLLEHLEGPTLDELIARDGALALEQVLPLALHVASALHYLAAEDVVHLDVKPSNVVMGAPPRLIDLSVARTVAEATAARGPIGTAAYMAPEQRGAGPLGPPADVWGLAATVHAALTGAPWRAGTTARREAPPALGAAHGEAPPARAATAPASAAHGEAPPARAATTPASAARGEAPPARAATASRGAAATPAVPLPRHTPGALRDVVAAGLDPDPASRPDARAFAEALEPLVAALPRRLTLGRRS